jgi:hypothetical protein
MMMTLRSQSLIFFGISLSVMGSALALYIARSASFQRFFGGINPMIVFISVILVGGASLIYLESTGIFTIYGGGSFYLESTGIFTIYGGGSLKSSLISSAPAVILAAVIVLVDLVVVLPEDINVLFPESLLFYPAMGYVAEIVFHVLPLSLLLFLLPRVSDCLSIDNIFWPCLIVVSLVEPVFQILTGFSGQHSFLTILYTNGLHVFLINLIQMGVFKRSGFVSMYSFRMVYYLLWHIVWGYVRLRTAVLGKFGSLHLE